MMDIWKLILLSSNTSEASWKEHTGKWNGNGAFFRFREELHFAKAGEAREISWFLKTPFWLLPSRGCPRHVWADLIFSDFSYLHNLHGRQATWVSWIISISLVHNRVLVTTKVSDQNIGRNHSRTAPSIKLRFKNCTLF